MQGLWILESWHGKYNIILSTLNCRTKKHNAKDGRGYQHSLASCENKSSIENDAWTKFEPRDLCDTDVVSKRHFSEIA